ncbi:MAG: hypothetical protein E7J70_03075, partial [Veillonella sp.]|nr:hypothetical protein [Veillonella sp.]
EPRQPGLWSSIYAKRYTITHITLRDMPHIDESRIGLNGSPTRVRKVYQPPLRGKVEMLSSVDEGAKKILELAYNIKPEKFSHLLVPSEELVEEPVDTNDEGVGLRTNLSVKLAVLLRNWVNSFKLCCLVRMFNPRRRNSWHMVPILFMFLKALF